MPAKLPPRATHQRRHVTRKLRRPQRPQALGWRRRMGWWSPRLPIPLQSCIVGFAIVLPGNVAKSREGKHLPPADLNDNTFCHHLNSKSLLEHDLSDEFVWGSESCSVIEMHRPSDPRRSHLRASKAFHERPRKGWSCTLSSSFLAAPYLRLSILYLSLNFLLWPEDSQIKLRLLDLEAFLQVVPSGV